MGRAREPLEALFEFPDVRSLNDPARLQRPTDEVELRCAERGLRDRNAPNRRVRRSRTRLIGEPPATAARLSLTSTTRRECTWWCPLRSATPRRRATVPRSLS